MADLFSVITDQGVMDQAQITLWREGVILAASEATNFMPGSPLISQSIVADGATATFLKFAQLTGGATLSDGVEVTSEAIVDSKAYATLIEHGNVVTITDMGDVSVAGRLNLAVPELVGKNMGTYVDKYFIQLLETSSNEYVTNAGGESSVTASDVITAAYFEKAYTFLRKNSIEPIMDGLYCGFIHPLVLADMRQATSIVDWTPVNAYSGANVQNILRNEIGAYKGFKLIQSANVTTNSDAGSSAVDTFHTSFFGYNALGAGWSASKGLQPTFVTGTDKLNRFAHIGWKGTFAGCLVDTNASVIVTSASAYGLNV
jgi:N4-gp56 family major capsid protein